MADQGVALPPWVEALVALQQSDADGLVEVEVGDADDDGDADSARAAALDALEPSVRAARRDAAASLDRAALGRFADAHGADAASAVAAVRRHVSFRARVRPGALAFPGDFETAAASGSLRVALAASGAAVLLFDSRRWHPWAYGGGVAAESVLEFERYVAYHFETAALLVDGGGADRLVALVLVADRPALLRPVALRCAAALIGVAAEYAGRLASVEVLGAPPLFGKAWALLSPLVDADTAARTAFIDDEDVPAMIAAALGEGVPGFAETGGVGPTYCGPPDVAATLLAP